MGDRADADGTGWRLRLRDGRGIRGAGVLIAPDRALTAAHVLPHADAELIVDYADYPGAEPARARALPGCVKPRSADPADGDVALLSVYPPRAGVRPVPLRGVPRYTGWPVRMGGFPRGRDQGLWVRARVEGPYGAWWQLTPEVPAYVATEGFSGTAVAGAQLEEVSAQPPPELLGMVVSRFYDDRRAPGFEQRHAYMIPLDRIAELLPEVRRLMDGPPPHDAALSAVAPERSGAGADPAFAARIAEWAAGSGPAVLLADAAAGSPCDLAFVAGLRRTGVAVDAAGRTADGLARALGERLRLPEPYGGDVTAWLRGTGPRPARRDSGRRLDLPVAVAVAGVDAAAEPAAAVAVLRRLAELDARLLVVFRRPGGPAREAAERLVECPALHRYARGLVRRVIALERGRPARSRVANRRNSALTAHRCDRDPVAELRALVDGLHADLARLENPP